MKLIYLLALGCLLSVGLNAQNSDSNLENNIIYKRVQVPSLGDATMNQLDALGIDLGCGVIHTNGRIQLELSGTELQRLDANGIRYNVLVEDLIDFYSKRSEQELESAKAELQSMKMQSALQRTFSVSELINNVGQHDDCDEIDWAVPSNFNLNPNPSPNSFGGCLTFDMVLQELDDMRAQYPNLISAKANASPSGQTTIEGRTVYYVRISDNPDVDEPNEPETLYQSLIHSRESATVMNQLFFMWYLLENYDSDPAIRALVNNQALYFIPVFNPDGFVHNQNIAPNGGGLQRKNRNIVGSCGTVSTSDDYGVDLNRNSAYYWGNGGASTNPCSQTYLGSAPFSENETQIMRDFFLQHDFELALNHHSFKNAMLHAYAGTTITNPRSDEYSKYNHDMTAYNRYAHGPSTSISSLNSGNMNDWMLGGPAGVSANGTPTGTGSGKQTLAWTPENGSGAEAGATGSGFWPAPSNFVPIAKRAMRMNFLAAYFSGKYAKLHDLSQTDINTLSGTLDFAVENLGQKASTFTVTVTPVSSNIASIGNAVTLNGMAVLQQNNVSINYTLSSGIQPNEEIEYKVTLTNDYATDNVLFEANIKKIYLPNVVLADNPDATGLNNWTAGGGSWAVTSDAFSGTSAIATNSGAYGNNISTQLQLTNAIDLSSASQAILQYYAKWDLERSFDYVQIEASTNGSTWTPLCGRLTKPGAPNINNTYSGKSSTNNNFQPDGEPLYDGDTQDRWAMEEIVIDANQNSFLLGQSNVLFRFDFRTDGSNREDSYVNVDFEGFTFDDFKVTTITEPCDNSNPPNNVAVSNIGTTDVTVSWDNIPSATYDVRYRQIGVPNWMTVTDLASTDYTITTLAPNMDYEVQVSTKCRANSSSFSSSTNFTTLSVTYCPSQSNNVNDEFISRVQLNTIDNSSGAQFYTDFTSISTTLTKNNQYTITVTPTWTGTIYPEGYSAWIDYNGDGDFEDAGEQLFTQAPTRDTPVSGTFTIPASASDITTRLRVTMNYNAIPTPCQTFTYGEVEDYTIVIEGNTPDTEAPVITLNGEVPLNLVVGQSYTELGATAIDNVDGDITANIVTSGTVDTSNVGAYIITYSVSDNAGNTTLETRTVNVALDTIPPTINLNGSSDIILELGNVYNELGATASDNIDGDLTAQIVTFGAVDTNISGTYTVTYSATDSSGNTISINRTIVVNPDSTDPVITLIGAETVNLNLGGVYTEQGALALDNFDGDISSNIVISGAVDTSIAGSYVIVYSVSDASGNTGSVSRTINVIQDVTAPIITLIGPSGLSLELGDAYIEQGATAQDDVDGDISANIVISGTVNTTFPDTYILTYSVADNAGNSSSVTRTITVNPDTTAPIITLNGPINLTLELGEFYTEQGATATDNVDGNLTTSIVTSGTVDTNTAGTYTVTYNVSDSSNNASSATRTITVNPDITAPEITLIGASSISLTIGDSYIDQGATATDNYDGDITANIVTTGMVDTNASGIYTLTYNVSDASGNVAQPISRTVTVNEIASGCSGGVSSFPYNQGFEGNIGAWQQSADDDLDWLVQSGSTPSNNTGPSSATEGNNYIYVEASGNNVGYPNKRAIITSPCFDLSSLTEATFNFKYHMYGTDIGRLDLEISNDEGATWTSLWNKSSNQGDIWLNVNVDLTAYVGQGVQLRFNRLTASTWRADVAVDDVKLIDTGVAVEQCASEVVSYPYNQGFEGSIGDWSQASNDDLDWTVDANGTPSNNTGPSSAIQGSNYLYVEASGNNTGYPSKRAILTSPCFDLTGQSSASFSFNYHMFGSSDMGSLSVQVSNDNGAIWTNLWTQTGNQGDSWQAQTIDLSAYVGNNIQLRFQRITGGTWQADVAIDNIVLNTSVSARGAQPNDDVIVESNISIIDDITLYPNPSSGQAIRVKTSLEIEAYSIFNALGQLVGRGPLNDDRIDVKNLEAGVYLINFKVENKTVVKRFIKR